MKEKKLSSEVKMRAALTGVVLVAMLSSCNRSSSTLMSYVPAESCAIVKIDWAATRNDNDLKRVIKADEFEQILHGLQIDSQRLSTVILFSGMDSQSMSGLLVQGSFDQQRLISQLKAQGWHEESLDGNKVFTNFQNCLALLGGNTLFAGTRDAARSVYQARKSSKESIVGSAVYKKISAGMSETDKPVKAFLLIPQGTLDMADAALSATSVALSFFNLGGIGQLLKAVNVARGFAFSLDHGSRSRYPVELCVLLRDEDTAVLVNGSLNAMKQLSSLAAMDVRDGEAIQEFRKMTISRKKEVLSVRMEMPREALFPPESRR